jgi:putative transposase
MSGRWDVVEYSRGYLPHIEVPGGTYMVTFCLKDAIPAPVYDKWRLQTRNFKAERRWQTLRRKAEAYLDEGDGSCVLKRPEFAETVDSALRFFDQERYELLRWVVMPNHVRDAAHLEKAANYIEANPVKRGLCERPEEWRWSSAWRGGGAG